MSAVWRWLPERWHQRWMDLSGRERLGLGLALLVLALALLRSKHLECLQRDCRQGASTQEPAVILARSRPCSAPFLNLLLISCLG
jgi:hypothetical protein